MIIIVHIITFTNFSLLSHCIYFNPQNTEQTPSKQHMQALAHQAQFHPIHQGDHHQINHSPHATHFMHSQQCVPSPQLPEIVHNQQPSAIAQHIACLQSLGHVGGRLHVMVGFLI